METFENIVYFIWGFILLLSLIILPIYTAYKCLIQFPVLDMVDKINIERGVATPRDPYFMKQNHTYYSTTIADINSIIERIDFEFLKKKSFNDVQLIKKVDHFTPIIGYNAPVVITRLRLFSLVYSHEEQHHEFVVVFEQVPSSSGYCYRLSIAENPLLKIKFDKSSEKKIRIFHNIFVTHIEQVLKDLDSTIEVERTIG